MKKPQPQPQLSPKKYIQTRARALPVHKCYVNADWEEAHIANVLVTRRHTSGNLTVGFYLVDLLCLGVKDTGYYFNVDEDAVRRVLSGEPFSEIDYPLAHNIVYAGHDFAMDFGIRPAKDFALTRFILEADTEAVPLIEVPVGGPEGKPFLIVEVPGQQSEALALLNKNAGEDNYFYATRANEDKPRQLAGASVHMADVAKGALTPLVATRITGEDLTDWARIEQRNPIEQSTLRVEACLRSLAGVDPALLAAGEADVQMMHAQRAHLIHASDHLAGSTTGTVDLDELAVDYDRIYNALLPLMEAGGELVERQVSALVEELGDHAARQGALYELLMINPRFARQPASEEKLRALGRHMPYGRMLLAFGALLNDDEPAQAAYADLYRQPDIAAAFPGHAAFHPVELYYYWLTQCLLTIRAGNLNAAVHWYDLLAETEITTLPLIRVQDELEEIMLPELEKIAPFPRDPDAAGGDQ